jgi:hypothetical protein
MKRTCVILCVSLFLVVSASCTRRTEKIIGIKIYEFHNNCRELASEWTKIGINTAFISRELAANKTFREALKEKKISVFIICPVFQNPLVLKEDSSLYAITNNGGKARADWVQFVCPSRLSYRKQQLDTIESYVKKYDPEGISIDFIRQFVFWEMIYPDRDPETISSACYCDSCLRRFCKEEQVIIPDSCNSTRQKAAYLNKEHNMAWNEFRCGLITTMVKDIVEHVKKIKPDILISIHAVPWRDTDFEGANIGVAAQNLKEIARYADYISPMCYSQMLKQDGNWISSVVKDMNLKAENKILPSIQVFPYYIDRKFTVDDFRECASAALQSPSQGIVFWSWPLFEIDPIRKEAVEELLH